MPSGHTIVPLSPGRRMVAATVSVNRERNIIHALTEVDISEPRRLIREHRARTGERLSMTAYVVACLTRAVAERPELNAFRRGRKLVLLEDITVNTLVERVIRGEKVPEPFPVRAAQAMGYREIHEAIRRAQRHESGSLGTLSGTPWFVRILPGPLMRLFVRLASRSITMAKRYGVLAVTSVGMFGAGAAWAIPLTAATVTVTVGSIAVRPVLVDGRIEEREHLCLTVSFDHELVDGAPATRFLKRFGEILAGGEDLRAAVENA